MSMGLGGEIVWDSAFERTYAVQECKWRNDSTLGTEGGEGDFNFLKAGPGQILQPKSISPLGIKNLGDEIVVDSDADDEGEVEGSGDQVERLAFWCGTA